MKLSYTEYVAQMRGFRQTPMSEADFNKMMGISTDTGEPCFLSPKYTKLKSVEPSLKEHTKRVRLS